MANGWNGFALWFMSFSTVLPTLIHFGLGLAAMVTQSWRTRQIALAELSQKAELSDADCTDYAKRLAGAALYGWAIAVLVLVPVGAGLWLLADAVLHVARVEAFFAWLFSLSPPASPIAAPMSPKGLIAQ